MEDESRTVRLRVSPGVARIVTPGASPALQLAAARGELPMAGEDLLVTLLVLTQRGAAEVRRQSLLTLKRLPAAAFASLLENPLTSPQVLDFLVRVRGDDPELMARLLASAALTPGTLARLAATAAHPLREQILQHPLAASPEVMAALPAPLRKLPTDPAADEAAESSAASGVSAADEDLEEEAGEAEEEVDPSKYRQSLAMEVGEKIKTAMTGDKEWRTIFIKDPNKLVSSAVLKNPRITEGEVLAIAKNKTTPDELIRLILVNREWIKNYALRKALVLHPKTPLPKALRFMDVLGLKDLKVMAKSRNISPVLVNNARRMVLVREKKR